MVVFFSNCASSSLYVYLLSRRSGCGHYPTGWHDPTRHNAHIRPSSPSSPPTTHPPPPPSHNPPTTSTPQSALSPCPSCSLPQQPARSANLSASAPQLSSSPQRESLCQVARIDPPATTESHPLSAFINKCTASDYTIHTHSMRIQLASYSWLLDKCCPETSRRRRGMVTDQCRVRADPLCRTLRSPFMRNTFEPKNPALVVIAHDVDPIELVIFLPALCRKMGVPYGIVN
jgi:Ribosomal protein L7Ae/L30e/S12e/Gadd45 family